MNRNSNQFVSMLMPASTDTSTAATAKPVFLTGIAPARDLYIDRLRSVMTALVILHHTAITYGAAGSRGLGQRPEVSPGTCAGGPATNRLRRLARTTVTVYTAPAQPGLMPEKAVWNTRSR